MKEIERFFRPEFINRLDDVIVFRPLTATTWCRSSSTRSKKVAERIQEQGFKTELTQAAKDFLIEKGYNPDFGARPAASRDRHVHRGPAQRAAARVARCTARTTSSWITPRARTS
jgi:hypothetical protein